MTGVVISAFLTRGFGFVLGEDKVSRFVHARDVQPPEDFAKLHEGVAVEFDPISGKKGPKAENVRLLDVSETMQLVDDRGNR